MPKFVSANVQGYHLPIPFHIPGSLSTGVKTPEFIAPVDMVVEEMRGRCSAGSSVTYRPVKNGSTNGTTSASTGTSVVTTSQSLSLAAGDRVQLEIVNAGSGGTDLSVTMWVRVS